MSWGERTVEVPWFLNKEFGESILDIGSAESCYVNEILAKNPKTLVLSDIRSFKTHESDPRVKCHIGDIRKTSHNKLGTFDTVLCISTLEHIALTAYDQKQDWKDSPISEQTNVLKHMMTFLKPDGKLILTVPYGKYEHGGWVIVYDSDAISKIRSIAEILEETYFTLIDRDNDKWIKCSQNECPLKGMDHYNGNMRATSVACLVLKNK